MVSSCCDIVMPLHRINCRSGDQVNIARVLNRITFVILFFGKWVQVSALQDLFISVIFYSCSVNFKNIGNNVLEKKFLTYSAKCPLL